MLHNTQDHIRIRAIREVFISLTKFTNARVIAFIYSHVFDNLEMKVGWPVAIFLRPAEVANYMASDDILKFGHFCNIFQA